MKKLLALVLALVMTLSLCITSNAAYADAADVDYNEAVAVMSAVGVFQGSDGKFAPKENLTREQAAKLIAYLDLGENTAEALPALKVFNDVEASRWSAKYVAYCADAGYIAGVGNGNFDPAGKLTGYAFGKMLLCVLGYDAAIEGFTGANWQIAVAKLMESNDIAKSVDASSSATLTREAAAQYCFNSLKANMVYYANSNKININGVSLEQGGTLTTDKGNAGPRASTANAAKATLWGNLDAANNLQLGEYLYGYKLQPADSTDSLGRTNVKWYYNSKANSNTPVVLNGANTVVGSDGDDASQKLVLAKDYTTAGTYASIAAIANSILKPANDYTIDETNTSNLAVYYNGDVAFTPENADGTPNNAAWTDFDGDLTATYADDLAPKMKPGTVIEFWMVSGSSTAISKAVVYSYDYAEITAVDAEMNTTEKNAGHSAQLTLKVDGVGTYELYDDDIAGYDAATYVKGANLAVALNADNTKVAASAIATEVTGNIEAAYDGTAAYYRVNGTKYPYAMVANPTALAAGTEATLYLDPNGYVISDKGVNSTTLDDVYIVVDGFATEENDSFGVPTYKVWVQVVDLAGKVSNVQIGSFNGANPTENITFNGGTTVWTKASNSITTPGSLANGELVTFGAANSKGVRLGSAWTTDGDYTAQTAVTTNVFTKDFSGREAWTGVVYRYNTSTKYIAVSETLSDVTVKTATGGISLSAMPNAAIINTRTKNVEYVIFANAGGLTIANNADDYFYVKSDTMGTTSIKKNGNDAAFKELTVVQSNGENKTILVENATSVTKNFFYKYEVKTDKAGTEYYALTQVAATDSTFTLATGSDKNWDDDYAGIMRNVYFVDLDGDEITLADATRTFYLFKIPAAGAKVIDLRSDIETDGVYATEINSVSRLANALENGAKVGNIVVDAYLNDDGAVILFVKDVMPKVSVSSNTAALKWYVDVEDALANPWKTDQAKNTAINLGTITVVDGNNTADSVKIHKNFTTGTAFDTSTNFTNGATVSSNEAGAAVDVIRYELSDGAGNTAYFFTAVKTVA